MIPKIAAPVRRRLAGWLAAGLLSGTAVLADFGDALAGNWTMTDEAPALNDLKNPAEFRISSVTPAKNDWSDGYFGFAWQGDTAATRGYYSRGTGRVWITTRRYVNGRAQQVEYRGGIASDGTIRWQGTAGTTSRPPTWWSFVAEKR